MYAFPENHVHVSGKRRTCFFVPPSGIRWKVKAFPDSSCMCRVGDGSFPIYMNSFRAVGITDGPVWKTKKG